MTRQEYTELMMHESGMYIPEITPLWWEDRRSGHNGLQLTSTGAAILRTFQKSFRIPLSREFILTPKIAVGLARNLSAPYYLSLKITGRKGKYIEFFSEEDATLLGILDSDLTRFVELMIK